MKYGLMLATGQLGWEATLEVAGRLRRRLRDRMASCDLDVVNLHGCRALCRFMYTEHGFAKTTMHDGGSLVHYRAVATDLWERLAAPLAQRCQTVIPVVCMRPYGLWTTHGGMMQGLRCCRY